MKENELVVVNISELAQRWQIPVERVQYLIVDCGMDMSQPENWAADNWETLMREKRAAFDHDLAEMFPRHVLHGEVINLSPKESVAKTS